MRRDQRRESVCSTYGKDLRADLCVFLFLIVHTMVRAKGPLTGFLSQNTKRDCEWRARVVAQESTQLFFWSLYICVARVVLLLYGLQ